MTTLPPPGDGRELSGRKQPMDPQGAEMRVRPLPSATPRHVAADMLDWSPGATTAVISSAQKFIIPVADFGDSGDPLVYPDGHEKAGLQITDYKGNPIGTSGIVFYNAKDKAVQAAPGNGSAVIILNQVTQRQADELYGMIASFGKRPDTLTLAELKQVLTFARDTLGLVDQYNSNRAFVKTWMTPVTAPPCDSSGREIEAYGLKKRDDRDICRAIALRGPVLYEGPTVTPQVGDAGLVVVKIGDRIAAVQPEIFCETYRLADGREISSAFDDLQVQEPKIKS